MNDIIPYDLRDVCFHPSEIPMDELVKIPFEPPFYLALGFGGDATGVYFIVEEWMKNYPIENKDGTIFLGISPLCKDHEIIKWSPGGAHPLFWCDGANRPESRVARGNRRAIVIVEKIPHDQRRHK